MEARNNISRSKLQDLIVCAATADIKVVDGDDISKFGFGARIHRWDIEENFASTYVLSNPSGRRGEDGGRDDDD